MPDRCVMCGEIIPEGNQVCWECQNKCNECPWKEQENCKVCRSEIRKMQIIYIAETNEEGCIGGR